MGARRIAWELAQRGTAVAPSRATVHRVLVRNAMVTPQAQRHKRKYRRWQREAPMALWQLDLVGGIYLADGRECKLLSGIDDHSRYVVIAAVLAVPSGRAVAEAFMAAMRAYGVPAEVLTDNGKQFTGRFTRPRPAEVLFERVCREHGITAQADQAVLADHHREDRTVAPDAAPRTARPGRAVRGPALRAGGDQQPGCTPITTPGRTRHSAWPPRPACSGPAPSPDLLAVPAPRPAPEHCRAGAGAAPARSRGRGRVRHGDLAQRPAGR